MVYWHGLNGREDAAERKRAAGEYVKILREAAGMTQLEVTKALGLNHYTFVSQVETGQTRLPSERIAGWADALRADRRAFAKRLLHYYNPHAWEALFGPSRGIAARQAD